MLKVRINYLGGTTLMIFASTVNAYCVPTSHRLIVLRHKFIFKLRYDSTNWGFRRWSLLQSDAEKFKMIIPASIKFVCFLTLWWMLRLMQISGINQLQELMQSLELEFWRPLLDWRRSWHPASDPWPWKVSICEPLDECSPGASRVLFPCRMMTYTEDTSSLVNTLKTRWKWDKVEIKFA